MSRRAGLCLLFLLPFGALAATPAEREIAGLLDHLGQSNCRFERNGRWHGADEARGHLERKLRYLRRRSETLSAEQFIQGAATQSSLTGQAYQVQCPGQPAQASANWFHAELTRLRTAE